jgi:hypothetical protein
MCPIKKQHHSKNGGKESLFIPVQMSDIRYQDARDLKAVVYTEFNIEGIRIIHRFSYRAPEQVLVPDVGAITSSATQSKTKPI